MVYAKMNKEYNCINFFEIQVETLQITIER